MWKNWINVDMETKSNQSTWCWESSTTSYAIFYYQQRQQVLVNQRQSRVGHSFASHKQAFPAAFSTPGNTSGVFLWIWNTFVKFTKMFSSFSSILPVCLLVTAKSLKIYNAPRCFFFLMKQANKCQEYNYFYLRPFCTIILYFFILYFVFLPVAFPSWKKLLHELLFPFY